MDISLKFAELYEIDEKNEAEIEKLTALLESSFEELGKVEDLFAASENPTDAELAEVKIEDTDYVKKETKGKLLKKIFADYQTANPKATTISYKHIKETLKREYSIECKSIANFFVGMLDGYETEGGNRNKAIVLPKG
ncbi:DUF1003 domain-containing protein [Rhodopirellula bahusiensis]|nr:DUF1003 domain-containing protein [Rhodopirellula bahusiensis]